MSKDNLENKLIVHVIGATVAGGAETFVVNLALAQAQSGRNLHILTLSNRSDAAGQMLRDRIRTSAIELTLGPTARVGLATLLWFRKTVRALQPAIIHLHTPNTEIVHWLATQGTFKSWALYRTVHNTKTTGELSPSARIALKWNRTVGTVACGSDVETSAKGFIADPVYCIPNGIDFRWPLQNEATKQAARDRLGLAKDAIHFISVGRMSAESLQDLAKGQDILLAAWKQAALPNRTFLHVLGDGSLRNKLAALVADDERVIFHGVRSDVSDWLLAADVFVMPSRWEGLPIAGIEAVGTGLRCIFSDIGPLRELSNSNTTSVPVNNPSALADALAGVMSTPIARSSDSDIFEFRKRYDIAGVARRYNELYDHTTAM